MGFLKLVSLEFNRPIFMKLEIQYSLDSAQDNFFSVNKTFYLTTMEIFQNFSSFPKKKKSETTSFFFLLSATYTYDHIFILH